MFYFQKLEFLSLRGLHVSRTSLLDGCTTMCHMTALDLAGVLQDSRSDEVLMAISTSMPHLQGLDIAEANVSPSAIGYLLPTEEPPRRGCPVLELISLHKITGLDVDFLKYFITGLPKLRHLIHQLMSNVLAELTDKEAQIGFKCLTRFYLVRFGFWHKSTKLRYDILQKAPEFAMTCNISRVDLFLKGHAHASLVDLLMPLTKLDSIALYTLAAHHRQDLLTVLESKGHNLKELHLNEVFETVSLHDIVRTCPSLCKFTLIYVSADGFADDHEKQISESIDMPYLSNLEELTLAHLSEEICPSEMLVALLVSPYLEKVKLQSVEALSNDHLLNPYQACSYWEGFSLKNVRLFYVQNCPKITATPFVRCLALDGTMLDDLFINNCNMVDEDVLHEAVKNYPRPLNVRVRPINRREFPGHMGTAFQGPCLKHCHYCVYDRQLSKEY